MTAPSLQIITWNLWVSAPVCAFRLVSSSVTSTLYWPLPSSVTLPGVADDSTSALSGGEIGERPWEYERKRRP